MGVDAEAAFQRRDRTLVAVLSLADAAGNADGLVGAGVVYVEVVGIHERRGMAYLAPQRNCVPSDRRAE